MLRAAEAEGVPAVRIGTTGGELLTIQLAAGSDPGGPTGSSDEVLAFDVAELAAVSDGVLRGLFD